jgi:hypothetical protein
MPSFEAEAVKALKRIGDVLEKQVEATRDLERAVDRLTEATKAAAAQGTRRVLVEGVGGGPGGPGHHGTPAPRRASTPPARPDKRVPQNWGLRA